MIVQASLVLAQSITLYFIMIGISKLHFEKSYPQVMLFMHVFNDNSAGLEKKL